MTFLVARYWMLDVGCWMLAAAARMIFYAERMLDVQTR